MRREAAYDEGQHYVVLLERLAALARDEAGHGTGSGGGVSVAVDGAMLSPKNGFVRALKHGAAAVS